MQYLGGKTRIAKQLAAEIDKVRRPGQLVWDAFCGGLSMSRALLKNGPVISTDACAPLIALYRAVQNGWEPPIEVDEAAYRAARTLPDSNPMKAFCGFGCSFGGKWFAGFIGARSHCSPAGAARALKRDCPGLFFGQVDFLAEEPRALDAVLYLDPPYAGTTGYPGAPSFNHAHFQARALQWSAFVPVFVSEYAFPFGVCVAGLEKAKSVAGGNGGGRVGVERLFYLAPGNTTAPDTLCTPGAVTTQKAEE